ncbi:MAG: YebC/PmpR family DNA-binding transcriptional regulator [Gemmatimonadetes bacterium]|uniref:Probable transcriptional regulatory protein GWO12_10465 n=1 Tax=Candidatus Kutchimonas denitrificans TaxID=3056748 RepID=A0AAE5CB88_9BACT|nr:YebC/PmpR family DNA-binding transcriptional regulator [Gemmatimonadota bacterium]NIR75512.1 YebC/PmpR family DNA-binding transcriptional regulator [Candidatus Kutchimonas denitrificans]NIS01826.1 YebC/PmpR family DNA-binding transcriptional regulator [Gemmatimonadota bacterium]NIT67607.1 YebC/PmpR family DNA-binding transcriptional regulator [Gemmatimonadota bacterium]NIU53481.1 YebC/PmpR family DNA-binding transcriptional regulator [Gemmatimonadota bacterium]
MAGHSKWSQIKRKKAAEDSKRGRLFGKLIREITVAAREGGGDPDGNPWLRTAIENAKAANMPKENIEKAILRGTGELPGVAYEDVTYEAYGPAAVAILIQAVTDNTNRTVADLRRTLEKHGGSLGSTGSVAWNFERVGEILVDASRYDEDVAFEAALEAGAEDLRSEGDAYVVTTDPSSFHAVQDRLRNRGLEIKEAHLAMVSKTTVSVEGREAEQLLTLLESLEDLDDVQNIYSNLDIDEALLADLAGSG